MIKATTPELNRLACLSRAILPTLVGLCFLFILCRTHFWVFIGGNTALLLVRAIFTEFNEIFGKLLLFNAYFCRLKLLINIIVGRLINSRKAIVGTIIDRLLVCSEFEEFEIY